MGKTVVKIGDIRLLYEKLHEVETSRDIFDGIYTSEFDDVVDEVFGVDISDIQEKENK